MTAKAPSLDELILAAWDDAPLVGEEPSPEERAMVAEGMADLEAGRAVSSEEISATLERLRRVRGG